MKYTFELIIKNQSKKKTFSLYKAAGYHGAKKVA